MTAVTPTSRKFLRRRPAFRSAFIVIALVLATSGALFAMTSRVASQDDAGTAVATPTVEELESLRDQAIADGVDQLELEFVEYNDSGVEGTVTLYDLDDNTLVAILIEEGGDVHPAHIHAGTCDDLDPRPFTPLSNVTNEEVSLSLVDIPLQELIDGEYAVDLHLSPNELGTLIVCADIEGTPQPATPAPDATPAATAVGGQVDATVTATQPPTPTEPAPTATATPTEAPATDTPAPTQTPVPTEPPPTETPTAAPTPTETVFVPSDTSDTMEDGTGGAVALPDQDDPPVADGMTAPPVSGKGDVIANADGTSGVGAGVVSGKGDAIASADGTSGVGGAASTADDRTTTTLPQTAGVGSTVPWPQTTTQAVIWALSAYALILASFAVMIRRAERPDRHPPRWNRLGI